MMKRLCIALLALAIWPTYAIAGNWNLSGNVKRLERLAPDYKDDKDIDKKFLDVLDLTEKTKKEDELYSEAKRIAANDTLAQSKYMDSFLYYMLVRAIGYDKTGTAEI